MTRLYIWKIREARGEMTDERMAEIEAIIARDGCCDDLGNGDVLALVAEVRRLRARISEMEAEVRRPRAAKPLAPDPLARSLRAIDAGE
jgi:hypothetical protein